MQKNSLQLYQSNTTITSDWNQNLEGLDKPQSFRILNSCMIVGLGTKTSHTLHGLWRAVLAEWLTLQEWLLPEGICLLNDGSRERTTVRS